MGSRVNFVFKDEVDTPRLVLYSHWGQETWKEDLAQALLHAKPRWNDSIYGTRMIVSHLIKDSLMSETGIGLFAINDNYDLNLLDGFVVLVDFTEQSVSDGKLAESFDYFISKIAGVLV